MDLPNHVIFYRALAAALMPFCFIILLVVYFGIIWILKKTPQTTNMIICYVVISIFLQPTVLKELTDIIACTEVEKNQFFLTRSMDLECNTSQHKTWVNGNISIFLFFLEK